MKAQKASPWMRRVLLVAAAYNVLWGAAVVAFPDRLFQLAGLPAPSTPEIVQCLGMVIGVYGIAYAAAASDPFTHWPVVAAGLLGKVLGPIGFVNAASRGRLPWRLGWTLLTNDLIWWAPFGLILAGAYGAYLSRQRCISPEVVRFALRTRTSGGMTLEQLSRQSPVLVVFLRHLGCTFCREALTDIANQRRAIQDAGTSIVLVHMVSEESGNRCLEKFHLSDVAHISDPCQHLYRAFGLRRGSLAELLGPRVLWRGVALLPKYGLGRFLGDGLQMPGAFLLYHGEVVRSYRHQSVADRPIYSKLATGEDVLEFGMQA